MQEKQTAIPVKDLMVELKPFLESVNNSLRESGLSDNEILGAFATQFYRALFDISFSDSMNWWRAGKIPKADAEALTTRLLEMLDWAQELAQLEEETARERRDIMQDLIKKYFT